MSRSKTVNYFCYLIVCACLICASALTTQINKIETISLCELNEIKDLFCEFFVNDVFSYSLFGDKPLSIYRRVLSADPIEKDMTPTQLDNYCLNIFEPCCKPFSILRKQWQVWCHNKKNFVFKNYLILQNLFCGKLYILFINKKAFLNVVNENLALFQKIIDPQLSADNLLFALNEEKDNLFDLIHSNQILFGILLGFGKHNPTLFQQRENLINALGKNLQKSDLLKKKIEILNRKLQPFHPHDSCLLSSINRVCFSADPTNYETIELRKKYDELNLKINKIYSQEDWFEQIILKLTTDYTDN